MTPIIRRSLILAGLAVLTVAAVAYAHGPGHGYGGPHMGGGYGGYHMMDGFAPGYGSQLDPDQREAYEALAQEHFDRMTELRDQALAAQNRLRTAETSEEAAQARTELIDIDNRMREQAATFRAEANERFGLLASGYGGSGYGCPGWNRGW